MENKDISKGLGFSGLAAIRKKIQKTHWATNINTNESAFIPIHSVICICVYQTCYISNTHAHTYTLTSMVLWVPILFCIFFSLSVCHFFVFSVCVFVFLFFFFLLFLNFVTSFCVSQCFVMFTFQFQLQTASLIIPSVQKQDSGNYTCSPSNSEPRTVILHVLNGKCWSITRFFCVLLYTFFCRF